MEVERGGGNEEGEGGGGRRRRGKKAGEGGGGRKRRGKEEKEMRREKEEKGGKRRREEKNGGRGKEEEEEREEITHKSGTIHCHYCVHHTIRKTRCQSLMMNHYNSMYNGLLTERIHNIHVTRSSHTTMYLTLIASPNLNSILQY